MIKCNATVCGVVCRLATQRTNNEGKTFSSFGMNVVIPAQNGIHKTVEIAVAMDGSTDLSPLQMGMRIEVNGILTFNKRGETVYFNLSASQINFHTALTTDCIKGLMTFRGKVGKTIDVRTAKNGNSYLSFSAFSASKVNDGFEYLWVRFLQFDKEQPAWLSPSVRIEAKGELELMAFNDKVNFSCRVSEMNEYVPNQPDE